MSKGIFVVMEQRYGKVQNVGLELVGEATRLKEDLKDDVVAVLLGHDIKGEVDKIFHYGADKVVLVDDPMLKDYVTEPYTKAVCEVIKAFDPEIMLFGASSIGRDVAPRVASRVKTGLVADTTGLRMAKTQEELDKEAAMGNATPERALLMTRPAFGGNIMATLMCPRTKPQMATVRPGVMKALARDDARTGEIVDFKVDFTPADMNVTIKEIVKEDKKKVDITEAKVLVSSELPSSLENSRNLPMYLAEKFLHQEQTLTQDGSRRIVRLDRQVRQYVLTSMLPAVFQELFSTLPVWKAQSI